MVRPILLASLVAAGLSFMATTPSFARDTPYHLKIADVKQDPRYAGAVRGDIQFFFADQKPANIGADLGEYVTNRKTNSVGKPDEDACRWAMMSALKELADRAAQEGGNAVINVVSYYKKVVFSSPDQYECHAGSFIAGVALKGTVVKLK